jgi:cytochrome c oxidase cbb3-type subunit 3
MSSCHLRRTASATCALWLVAISVTGTLGAQQRAAGAGPVQGAAPQGGGRGQASPAAQRPPQTVTPQQYPAEQVDAGRTRFAAQCGFCHGRDAAGGEGGTDLTRSTLVASDVRGDKIAPLLRTGRIDRGMPAFTLTAADVAAIVAFIHHQKTEADSATGGRRAVDAADLSTGNAADGKRYFDAACSRCHSAAGDLAGIATRLQGLPLLQRMLYPGAGGRGAGPPPAPPTVTLTTSSGETITGKLAYRDEFTIAVTDASGWYRAWPARQVRFTVDDPLQAHLEQLAKYTDADIHDVFAYLQTLR